MTFTTHRILLTGAAGGLGQALRPRLASNCSVLRLSDIAASVAFPGTPATLGLGQGGGAPAPSSGLSSAGISGRLTFTLENGRVVGIISIGDLVKSIISDREFAIEQLEHYIHGIGT